MDLEDWILLQLKDFDTSYTDLELEIKECFEDKLLCKLKYSHVLLKDMITKAVVDAYEIKKTVLEERRNNITDSSISNSLYYKIRFQLMFAQQLDDQISISRIYDSLGEF